MNEIMSQFLTSEVQTVLFALLGIVVVLYLLSIFWAARDARARGFGWAWGLLSVVPIVGLVAYAHRFLRRIAKSRISNLP